MREQDFHRKITKFVMKRLISYRAHTMMSKFRENNEMNKVNNGVQNAILVAHDGELQMFQKQQ